MADYVDYIIYLLITLGPFVGLLWIMGVVMKKSHQKIKINKKILLHISILSITFLLIGMALDETGRAIIHRERIHNYPELRYIIPSLWICGIIAFRRTLQFRHWSLFKAKRLFFLIGCLFTTIEYTVSGIISNIVNELLWYRKAGFGYTWSIDFIVSMMMFGVLFVFFGYWVALARKERKWKKQKLKVPSV